MFERSADQATALVSGAVFGDIGCASGTDEDGDAGDAGLLSLTVSGSASAAAAAALATIDANEVLEPPRIDGKRAAAVAGMTGS